MYLQSSREMFMTMLNDSNFRGYLSRSILNAQTNPTYECNNQKPPSFKEKTINQNNKHL